MDQHFTEYFHEFSEDSPTGNFHRVVPLHESPELGWEELSKKAPALPRGWFELAQLSREDRIEFTHEFWESRLEYYPHLSEFFDNFFKGLDDVGIYITQKLYDQPFEAQLVYSLDGDSGFYRGSPPATDDQVVDLQFSFPDITFPSDYIAFLQVHNGFYKTTDVTGLGSTEEMKSNYEHFQQLFDEGEVIYSKNNLPVNPKTLIPFYESFGMPYYQCFWSEWYPEHEMGNVYFSGKLKQISDISSGGKSIEHLAFATFTEWLMFYLERIG